MAIWSRLKEDVLVALERDPAARSVVEVLLCYPGLHALLLHRVGHSLWRRGLRLPARVLSAFSRFLTGIDIHPGARIGRHLFIDHGFTVIGETADIGDNVTIYQCVTLGGTNPANGKGGKRQCHLPLVAREIGHEPQQRLKVMPLGPPPCLLLDRTRGQR